MSILSYQMCHQKVIEQLYNKDHHKGGKERRSSSQEDQDRDPKKRGSRVAEEESGKISSIKGINTMNRGEMINNSSNIDTKEWTTTTTITIKGEIWTIDKIKTIMIDKGKERSNTTIKTGI